MAYRRSSRPVSREAPRRVFRGRSFDSRPRASSRRSPSFRAPPRARSPSYVMLRPRGRYDYGDRSRSRSQSYRQFERLPSRWSPVRRSISPSPRPFRYESMDRPPKDLEVPQKRKRRVRRKIDGSPDRWSPKRDAREGSPAYASPRRDGESRNGHKMRRPSSSNTDAGPPGTWECRSKSKDHYRARRRSNQEYLQMAAQQVAMMRFMHHPGYMAMMQQQMGMMSPMMGMQRAPAKGRSSSSDSYSSSGSNEPRELPGGTMFPVPPPMPVGPDVEGFLKDKDLEPEVAERLRLMPPHLQHEVMRRGPLDSRSPTSTLLSRMKQALEADRNGQLYRGPAPEMGMRPMKQTAKNAIEALISDFGLSPGCAWMLRSLPPDKQKLAAKIDPSGQADPSGYVAEELKQIV